MEYSYSYKLFNGYIYIDFVVTSGSYSYKDCVTIECNDDKIIPDTEIKNLIEQRYNSWIEYLQNQTQISEMNLDNNYGE